MKNWWTTATNNQRVGLVAVMGLALLYATDNLWSVLAEIVGRIG